MSEGLKGSLPFKAGEIISEADISNKTVPVQDVETEVSTDEIAETKEEVKPPMLCPRCGWNTSVPTVIEITDEDKIDFQRSILGGRSYKKTFELLNGQVIATFVTLTPVEVDGMLLQLKSDATSHRVENEIEYLNQHSRYRLSMCLRRLEIVGADTPVTEFTPPTLAWVAGTEIIDGYKEDPTQIRFVYDKMVKGWSEPLYTMLLIASQQFHRECDILTQRAADPAFWKRTDGLA